MTMYLLEQEHYRAVLALAEEMRIHLALESVLKNKSPGRVMVTDPIKPTAVFITVGQRSYLIGSSEEEASLNKLGGYLRNEFFPAAVRDGRRFFVLYFWPYDWEDRIELMLEERQPNFIVRQYLTTTAAEQPEDLTLPSGYSLHPIRPGLLEEPNLKNRALLVEEMMSESPSVEHFFSRCFGVYVRYKDALVGWCLSEYNVDGKCEVGIETLKEHQRRGLGTAMARALIMEAHRRGYQQVGWHSYKHNKASAATAQRAGFLPVAEYPACLVELK